MAKILSKKEILKSKPFTIKNAEILFSNNETKFYDYIEKKDSVMIIPKKGEKLILIKEWGVGENNYFLTFPKGSVENDEVEIESCNKELQEEIGYRANKLTKISQLTISPTNTKHLTHIYLAEDLVESKLTGDEQEPIEVLEFSLEEIDKLIKTGELKEARTIAAFYLYRNL